MPDRFENGRPVPEQVRVPDAQHPEIVVMQPAVAPRVRSAIRVLRTIQLDHQPRFEADEIRDEGTDRNLTAKLEAAEPPAAQDAPQDRFRPGLVLPQDFGEALHPLRRCNATIGRPLSRRAPPSPLRGLIPRTRAPVPPSPLRRLSHQSP